MVSTAFRVPIIELACARLPGHAQRIGVDVFRRTPNHDFFKQVLNLHDVFLGSDGGVEDPGFVGVGDDAAVPGGFPKRRGDHGSVVGNGIVKRQCLQGR